MRIWQQIGVKPAGQRGKTDNPNQSTARVSMSWRTHVNRRKSRNARNVKRIDTH